MYVGYQQIGVTNAVFTAADLTIPANAHGAELQADGQNVRYIMDDARGPTNTIGMLLLTTSDPKYFSIEDIRRIRFTRAAVGAVLNIHYVAGRDV